MPEKIPGRYGPAGHGPAGQAGRPETGTTTGGFTSRRRPASFAAVEKILVIDDDAMMRRQITALLAAEGYGTAEARNGREGLALAAKEKPALVLCDITMPEMNGHRVLEAVRADPAIAHLPFIFLTGWGEKEDLRTGMNLGADDYLVKPVEPAELLAAVKTRLRRHQSAGRGTTPLAAAKPEALQAALGLTPREAEILSWVVQGKTNPEIGIILGIQLTTVKKHLESTFAKLGVENRTGAVTLALEKISAAR
jgi:DNA-binding NarL/FixJ family response regulator